MSNSARNAILSRLLAAPETPVPARPDWQPPVYSGTEKIQRFATLLRGQHADVLETTMDRWPDDLAFHLQGRSVHKILAGPLSLSGQTLASRWQTTTQAPELLSYDGPAEAVLPLLLEQADAGLTGSYGGIAETGSVILWPDVHEPRLLSLLPPLHIVLVRASRIFSNLTEAMADGHWAGAMPTNLLLISGPSKTADIEQTLAYGVHGPKELLVLLLTDG